MLIDERRIDDHDVIQTDICVIGAGPAGITFAREFIGTSAHVTVIESGQFDYDEEVQRLADGDVDSYYFDENAIADGRRRQFGGTANLWIYSTEPDDGRRYARSLPPEPVDLAPRAGQPETGWPMTFEDLNPFFQRAQAVWNSGQFDYEVNTWASDDAQPIETASSPLATRICQHGPSDVFYLRYRDDLLAADNIDLHLNCTALEFDANRAGDRARVVRLVGKNGKTFSIAAKIFVTACGGVENVQLLLTSDFARPGRAGNRHDNLGRYVTSHPEFRMGTTVPGHSDKFDDLALYDVRWVGRHMVSAFLTLADEIKQSEGLLNMSVGLIPRGAGFGTDAHRAMASFAAARRRGESQTDLIDKVRSVLRSPRHAANALTQRESRYYEEWRGGWSQHLGAHNFEAVELWAAPEQSAEHRNRLTLSDKRDRLGRNQITLDYRWSQADRDNIQRSIDIFGSLVEGVGLGPFKAWNEFEGAVRPRQEGFHHPMGGTRMHVDPRMGVVDPDCLVHGLENVYVAGSSVFPTGLGYANPTLTLLALSLRLADHIKAELGALETPIPAARQSAH
jgi:choline dehydrogenase-like flavoprotein